MTCFASVDDILKIVDKKGRRDLRYCHLAFAIRADFHCGHYRTSQLGAHAVPFPRQMSGRAHELTLDWVPVTLKSKSLRTSPVALRQRLDQQNVRPLSNRVEENDRLRSSMSPHWYGAAAITGHEGTFSRMLA